jgi:hypothetical protein
MFSDPLSVTVDGSAKSLPRVGASKQRTTYRTADGTFEIKISDVPGRNGAYGVSIELAQKSPDPTPANVFDDYRDIVNAFGITYRYDVSRSDLDDLPVIRTALLALVNSGFETRLLSGEK